LPHSQQMYYANHTRYLILIISTLALSIITSNTLILNFTIICMSDETAQISNTTAQQSCEFFLFFSFLSFCTMFFAFSFFFFFLI
uniref:G_PROTEIN_RECEP_F1_2 domain-containing protein n=1 Tax=Brugia timori TaxID=42155 RepID=A0A0R3RDH1_9BILA